MDEQEARGVLSCGLCLYVIDGTAADAVTIISGQAVCYDHMGYAVRGDFSLAIIAWRREHPAEMKS